MRPSCRWTAARTRSPDVSRETLGELLEPVIEQIEIAAKYSGYIERQKDEVERAAYYENLKLPADLDYMQVPALSIEVRQKLNKHRPETLGLASRISGVTPAAISLLLVHLKKSRSQGFAADAGSQSLRLMRAGTGGRASRWPEQPGPDADRCADCPASGLPGTDPQVEQGLQPDGRAPARRDADPSSARQPGGDRAAAAADGRPAHQPAGCRVGCRTAGVVIAICCPEIRVDCVDTVAKKAAFVQQAAATLALRNLRGVHDRVENLSGPYDVIASRAFASLADFITWSSAALAEQGVWLAMKGKQPTEEIAALPPRSGNVSRGTA